MQSAHDTWSIMSNLVSITEQSEVFMTDSVLQFTAFQSGAFNISCVWLKLIFQQISSTELNKKTTTTVLEISFQLQACRKSAPPIRQVYMCLLGQVKCGGLTTKQFHQLFSDFYSVPGLW